MAMPPEHNANMLGFFGTKTTTSNVTLNFFNATSSVGLNKDGKTQLENNKNIDKAATTSPQSYVQHDPSLNNNQSLNGHSATVSGYGNDDTTFNLNSNSSHNHKHNVVSGEYYPARPSREDVLKRLSEALLRRSLHKLDLSQRSLQPSDARLVKMALAQNANLTVLKLGYNNLGDVGVITLAAGIVAHKSLSLLDLGFNNIGDEGIKALAHSMQNASYKQRLCKNGDQDGYVTLHTLYLAGNVIGEDGAMAIADFLRQGSRLRKLFMTGNRIGGDGVKVITEAILEQEMGGQIQNPSQSTNTAIKDYAKNLTYGMEKSSDSVNGDEYVYGNQMGISTSTTTTSNFHGMQQLFLGGTGMELIGCQAVSRLLEKSCYLRVLSLPNCDIGDDEVCMLASCIKSNKGRLPIECLQLSFNDISHKGLEAITNALWGSTTLREFKVDNNLIGDRGAHQMAAIIPTMKVLEILDVGFNSITAPGLTVLMKSISESQILLSLSISGNAIDANAAKSVAYALAYNFSLQSIFLVHCSIGHEEQRHISAGIVSNSRTALERLNGFEIGPILLTLGFPEALKNWTNEQVFNFIHLMWDKNDEIENFQSDLERDLDPLSFLSNPMHKIGKGISSLRQSGPLEATVVVEVAKTAFENLVANGIDVTSRRLPNTIYPLVGSPLATDAIITESPPKVFTVNHTNGHFDLHHTSNSKTIKSTQSRSFVAHPESPKKQEMPDPARKKRIIEWLCSNSQSLNELAQLPFSSSELWKLHQFYFTPVVKESGGSSCQRKEGDLFFSSVPEVHRMHQNGSAVTHSTHLVDDRPAIPMSDPAFSGPASSSIPMLKRKVSYRFLGDATPTSNEEPHLMDSRIHTDSVAKIIEQGHTGHSLPPKTKRARRNRTRISFLPRIKAKLDGYLDVCHEKALITMKQLYIVEQAILSGKVIPIKSDGISRTHLSGILASDAEMIIVDMM